ncbi:peptidoglycan-binding domain-containing protein [Streptomyces sp. NPDC007084]|uniref:peptidoglycan-binding domain-containing protein n=1 Tax=Streptomyces sp. NPDC007084 TaxID=3154313 RepID=UPI0034526D39
MTEQTGHVCPRCAARRAPDGTPSCTCTRHASDALREARTAQAAAAEDFDPLRIRPYVELSGESGVPGEAGVSGEAGDPGFSSPATMRLAAIPADAVPPTSSALSSPSAPSGPSAPSVPAGPPADETMRLTALPSEPRAADVRLFQESASDAGPGVTAAAPRPGRRRRNGILAAAGVVVTVAAAAGFAGGLLSYDTPARDSALPEDVRASVPDVSPKARSVAPSASTSPTASASEAPASSPSASPSPSAPESAGASASASESAPSSPTPPPATATATATESPQTTGAQPGLAPGPTLRRGDNSAEVTELQLRMRQLRMYMGDADGYFDRHLEDAVRWYQWARGITSDPAGVYGPATRASLESETSQP